MSLFYLAAENDVQLVGRHPQRVVQQGNFRDGLSELLGPLPPGCAGFRPGGLQRLLRALPLSPAERAHRQVGRRGGGAPQMSYRASASFMTGIERL